MEVGGGGTAQGWPPRFPTATTFIQMMASQDECCFLINMPLRHNPFTGLLFCVFAGLPVCVGPRGQILSRGGMRCVGVCPPRWPSESGFLHNIGTAGNAGKRTRLALQSQKLTRMQTRTPDLIFNLGGSLFCRFSRFSSTVVQLLILWRQDQNGEGRITSLRIVSRTLYKQAAAPHKTGTVKIF